MSNIQKKSWDFTYLFLATILLYNLHSNLELNYSVYDKTPINSIYIFNFFAVLFFLISSRFNIAQKLVSPLTLFILLTFIKMLAVIIFFLYFTFESSVEGCLFDNLQRELKRPISQFSRKVYYTNYT